MLSWWRFIWGIWLIKSLARKKYMSSNAKALLAIGILDSITIINMHMGTHTNLKRET